MGLAFAFGWTPCIGPILAAILAVAGAEDTVARGALLLLAYALGLGLPFVIAALAMERFLNFARGFPDSVRTVGESGRRCARPYWRGVPDRGRAGGLGLSDRIVSQLRVARLKATRRDPAFPAAASALRR